MLIAQHFSRYARHDRDCPLHGYPILPADTRCRCGLSEAARLVEANEQANECDRATLQEIIEALEKALPGFKGCPAPTDWALAAIRELAANQIQSAPLLYKCSRCGQQNAFVNQCGCDPGNMPTRPEHINQELLEALTACLNQSPALDHAPAGPKARAAIAKAIGMAP